MAVTKPTPVMVGPGKLRLPGVLRVPEHPVGLIISATVSGSGRADPRSDRIAESLAAARFASLLVDLVQPQEEEREVREPLDVARMAERLLPALEWARDKVALSDLPIGLFGEGVGAAAALVAAAEASHAVWAVVCRGGRVDLAGAALHQVKAPTLLIVGASDVEIIDINDAALAELRCPKSLLIVPGADQLFEQPGTLGRVIGEATRWYSAPMTETSTEEVPPTVYVPAAMPMAAR